MGDSLEIFLPLKSASVVPTMAKVYCLLSVKSVKVTVEPTAATSFLTLSAEMISAYLSLFSISAISPSLILQN